MIKLDTYYFPEQEKEQIEAFITHYNNRSNHESLDNLAPADDYFGRSNDIINRKEQTKIRTLKKRRQDYLDEKLQKMVS